MEDTSKDNKEAVNTTKNDTGQAKEVKKKVVKKPNTKNPSRVQNSQKDPKELDNSIKPEVPVTSVDNEPVKIDNIKVENSPVREQNENVVEDTSPKRGENNDSIIIEVESKKIVELNSENAIVDHIITIKPEVPASVILNNIPSNTKNEIPIVNNHAQITQLTNEINQLKIGIQNKNEEIEKLNYTIKEQTEKEKSTTTNTLTLKNNFKQMLEQIGSEMNKKIEIKDNVINSLKSRIEKLEAQIVQNAKQETQNLASLNSQLNSINKKFFTLLTEKNELEEMIIKQEKIIDEINTKNNMLSKLLYSKSKEFILQDRKSKNELYSDRGNKYLSNLLQNGSEDFKKQLSKNLIQNFTISSSQDNLTELSYFKNLSKNLQSELACK